MNTQTTKWPSKRTKIENFDSDENVDKKPEDGFNSTNQESEERKPKKLFPSRPNHPKDTY